MAESTYCKRAKCLCQVPFITGTARAGKFAYTGLFQSKKGRNDVPVKAFLIRINGKNVLVDTGLERAMRHKPTASSRACSLLFSQPTVTLNDNVAKQLGALGITPEQLDAVILTHLDCDHVSGLKDLKGAKHIYATKEELEISLLPNPRYRKALWQGVEIEPIEMNYDSRAPFGKSCDLFGDGSVRIVYTPGHSAALFAL